MLELPGGRLLVVDDGLNRPGCSATLNVECFSRFLLYQLEMTDEADDASGGSGSGGNAIGADGSQPPGHRAAAAGRRRRRQARQQSGPSFPNISGPSAPTGRADNETAFAHVGGVVNASSDDYGGGGGGLGNATAKGLAVELLWEYEFPVQLSASGASATWRRR